MLLKKITTDINGNDIYSFYCPGCEWTHHITSSWQIENINDKPTVSPSVLTKGGSKESTCHLFIKAGMIQYLSDCGHKFAGQTIPMVDIEPHLMSDEEQKEFLNND